MKNSIEIGIECGEFIMATSENTASITNEYLVWMSIADGFGLGQSHVMVSLL